MKIRLFDFQNDALAELRSKLEEARRSASIDNPKVISFSAPTGSGKTIIMTALFENIFKGTPDFEEQSDAVILWISDMPELNKQTRLKIESKAKDIRMAQLLDIDSNFDAERLAGGFIYFVNTQKLGSDTILTQKGDDRQYTIWETLTNTAKAAPNRFYVVIDEAHRGMRNRKAAVIAETIMQKFLKGYPEDGLCQMPLVIGITATPERFIKMLSDASITFTNIPIRVEDVKKSGLLKERIVIHCPVSLFQAEMTVLTEAANRWMTFHNKWEEYCKAQTEIAVVKPILVIQVEDRSDEATTKTNLGACLNAIEAGIGHNLCDDELAHTFNNKDKIQVGERTIQPIEASRIEENHNIRVVFFKMSLSTGWDCPRAEVLMSFRQAEDHTYIAQLLGRMVRTPLARRVDANADLNDVHLYLPHFNQDAVESVINDLENIENVSLSEVGFAEEMTILSRRNDMEDVFTAMGKLKTYRINAVRKQSALHRLMGLGRQLTNHNLDKDALNNVKNKIINMMNNQIQQLQESGKFENKKQQYIDTALKEITVDYGDFSQTSIDYSLKSISTDVDKQFDQAGRILSEGIHKEYWRAHEDRDYDEVKIEVIVLANHHKSMERLINFAAQEFNELYDKYTDKISNLNNEEKIKRFENLCLAANDPRPINWTIPDSIDYCRPSNSSHYTKHLFIEKDGTFRAYLKPWEKEVIEEELSNPTVIGWLRNMDRKHWSLEIPYEVGGEIKPMFPDFIVVRRDEELKKYLFDILEPHNPSLIDNVDKAKGLAKFALQHHSSFGRIQLIRKQRGADNKERYFRLDFCQLEVRTNILKDVTNNKQLDNFFMKHRQTM